MKKRWPINWIAVLCALAAMAAAILVRLPAAQLSGLSGEQRETYSTASGTPYLTDPDSYFYTRITDNWLTYGHVSGNRAENGVLWDTQSRYPEGRSAVYQPGIVYVTGLASSIAGSVFHVSLYEVEFWMPAVLAALAALAAFFAGRRMSGNAGGFTAGILVSCATAFVARVLPGRFDTDMFAAVMDVLLIWMMAEALLAKTLRKQLAAAAGFALVVLGYTWCWSVYAFMFSVLSIVGGAVCILVVAAAFRNFKMVRAWVLCICFMTAGVLLANGPSFFSGFFGRISWAGSMTESGKLPNLLASVTELNRPVIVPSDPAEWFVSYVPGKTLSVLNGVGGMVVVILCAGGLAVLLLSVLTPVLRRREFSVDRALPDTSSAGDVPEEKMPADNVVYLCLLCTWLAGSLYASFQGIRFVEHLAVPVGLLAGCCVGWIVPGIAGQKMITRVWKGCLTVLVCVAAVVIPVTGSVQICRQNRPSVSDALSNGMVWIREHAEAPEAVIASWWDLGYFYEYESGHPAFWDGGSQSGIRAILIAKALTSRDMQLSGRILQMLASYGDRPAEELIRLLGEERAFEALWIALPMDPQDTAACLNEEYGVTREQASELSHMLHPETTKEIYLVLSGDMLYKLGWIEYYADWDFTGKGQTPAATVYSVMPDGSADIHSDKEEAREFFSSRAEETIWKLFFHADGEGVFEPAFEESDGINQIQIWRVK